MTALAATAEGALVARARAGVRASATRRRWIVGGGQAALFLALLLAWQAASGRLVDREAVSDPVAVLGALAGLVTSGRLWPNLAQTLFEVAAGFAAGSLIGLGAALLFAAAPLLHAVLRPFLIAFYAIPKIALAPLIIMWFGLGVLPKVILAASFVFFVVFMNVVAGLEAVNPRHAMLARLMGAGRGAVLRKIVIPTIVPYLVAGLRLAVPEAVIGAVIGEFIAANEGLGYLITSASAQFNMAVSFAAILALLAIVAAADGLLQRVEAAARRFLPADRDAPLA